MTERENFNASLAKMYRGAFLTAKREIDKKIALLKNEDEIKNYLQNTLRENILKDEAQIRKEFALVKCKNCGKCCRLAVSEFSPDELMKKAKSGDKTAKSFISVFSPCKNPEKELYIGKDGYFYSCKKVQKRGNNYFCPIYDERPDVCRNFPDTPLENLPDGCAYFEWKDKNEVKALFLKALVDIRKFYLNELNQR